MEEVTLKEFLLSQITNIKEATKLALETLEKRLEGMNEFRDTLKDQTGTFVTRREMDAKIDGIQKDVQTIQKIVWMGLGAMAVIQLLLKFFIK